MVSEQTIDRLCEALTEDINACDSAVEQLGLIEVLKDYLDGLRSDILGCLREGA
jgi:hypothetical protein